MQSTLVTYFSDSGFHSSRVGEDDRFHRAQRSDTGHRPDRRPHTRSWAYSAESGGNRAHCSVRVARIPWRCSTAEGFSQFYITINNNYPFNGLYPRQPGQAGTREETFTHSLPIFVENIQNLINLLHLLRSISFFLFRSDIKSEAFHNTNQIVSNKVSL